MSVAWRRAVQTWAPGLQRRLAQRAEQIQKERPALHPRAAEFLAFEELEPEALRQKAARARGGRR